MAIFLMTVSNLCFFCCTSVDSVDYTAYGGMDFLVAQNLLFGIHEENIHSIYGKGVLLFSIAFPNASFQEISLDGPFE